MRKFNGLLRYTPGHRARRLLPHRHGLFQQVEFDRPDSAARRSADRSFRFGRPERRRQDQPLRAVGAHRGRPTTRGRGRPMPMPSKASSTSSTTSPISCAIPCSAINSTSTTTAIMAGANASRTLNGSFAGLPMQTTFGVQTRYDEIDLALTDTFRRGFLVQRPQRQGRRRQRRRLCPEHSAMDRLAADDTRLARRLLSGARRIRSSTPTIPARRAPAIGSPKFTMVLGPFNKTEFFSAQAKACTATMRAAPPSPKTRPIPPTKLSASPLLVRTKGAEIGVRTKIIPGLDSSLSVFMLDQDSEIVFQRRCRRHFRKPGQPALRRRMDQPLSAGVVDRLSTPTSRMSHARFRRLRQRTGGVL